MNWIIFVRKLQSWCWIYRLGTGSGPGYTRAVLPTTFDVLPFIRPNHMYNACSLPRPQKLRRPVSTGYLIPLIICVAIEFWFILIYIGCFYQTKTVTPLCIRPRSSIFMFLSKIRKGIKHHFVKRKLVFLVNSWRSSQWLECGRLTRRLRRIGPCLINKQIIKHSNPCVKAELYRSILKTSSN